YGGNPIECWLPAELASQRSWEQYAESYCFVENTYYIPMEQNIPQSKKHRNEKLITYYQWVPFTLILQAMLFVIPHIFWRMLNWTANVQTRAVISMANSLGGMDIYSEEAQDILDTIANHIYRASKSNTYLRRTLQNSNLFVTVVRFFIKSYLSTIYLITKLLFSANAIIQFFIISMYLGGNGYHVTKALIQERSWQHTGVFPRVTLCDFKIRAMGNIHHHTIQCVLMANMLNEKIYIGLWWWLLILSTLTIINSFYWFYVLNSTASSFEFMTGLITLGVSQPRKEMSLRYMQFVTHFIGDPTFVLRLVAQNSGELVTSHIVTRLFDIHMSHINEELVYWYYTIDSYSLTMLFICLGSLFKH
ncbi:unnamed protein product, partial [Thelazia callipaeda]|uniref:Innexin n=1 Tax=Thelazia callipaeda TaxID=103827 RepID=A0A0N5D538_THECL